MNFLITIGYVRPAKIQIRSDCASEFSLGAFWIVKHAMFLGVDNEDSDQTARMLDEHVRRYVFSLCDTYILLEETIAHELSSLDTCSLNVPENRFCQDKYQYRL